MLARATHSAPTPRVGSDEIRSDIHSVKLHRLVHCPGFGKFSVNPGACAAEATIRGPLSWGGSGLGSHRTVQARLHRQNACSRSDETAMPEYLCVEYRLDPRWFRLLCRKGQERGRGVLDRQFGFRE